jgi:hypothetical protein
MVTRSIISAVANRLLRCKLAAETSPVLKKRNRLYYLPHGQQLRVHHLSSKTVRGTTDFVIALAGIIRQSQNLTNSPM